MTVRAQLRITTIASLGLAALAAAILALANYEINLQVQKNLTADRISKDVYELSMITRSYLAYGEEGPRNQLERKYASMRRLIRQAQPPGARASEHLENLEHSSDELGLLFDQIVQSFEKNRDSSAEVRELQQEVIERLGSRAVATGQEMVHYAFLLIQESNRDLAAVKTGATILILVCILLIIAAYYVTYLLLRIRLLPDLVLLERGTELIAAGDLSHRLAAHGFEEIARLAAAFNEMAARLSDSERQRESFIRRLSASNRELEEFAFVASHDLQEPLRKIQAFGDRLQVKCGASLSADCRDYLQRMQGAAQRMHELISDLLSYSRLSNKPQAFSPVALAEVLKEAVADLAVIIERAGASVEVGELPVIECNPNQMRQLFQNLLGNSLKFRSEAPPVVRVSSTPAGMPAGEPGVMIRVEDNGIGFDEKYLDRLFQPFQRLHGRSEYEGTGMGLAICRKIVERHGGTLTARSAPGRGATFLITLPAKQPRGLRED
jgi:signal transduction histidine kinase